MRAEDDGSGTAPFVVQPYRNFGLFCAGVLALIAAGQLTSALHRGAVGPVVTGVVGVAVAVLMAAESLVARVEWNGTRLRRYDLLRGRTVTRSAVGTVLLLRSYRRTRRAEPTPLLVFLDPGGRALLRLGGGMWHEEEVERLAGEVAGDAVERIDATTGVAELERLHPGALTVLERHRKLVFALTVVYLVAVVWLDLRRW